MNTTKKLAVLCMAAFMAVVCVMPSTFSWYAHSGKNSGDAFKVQESLIPVSSSSNFSSSKVTHKKVDKFGVGDTTVSKVNFASSSTKIQYYKSTFDNSSGSGDVYVDLELKNVRNNSGVMVGVTNPVVTEKGFNISKTPATNDTTRVYFIPTSNYSSFWWNTTSSSSSFDMNICYSTGSGDPVKEKMTVLSNTNSNFKDGATGATASYVCYYDLPNNTTSFFFFNHWYNIATDNKDWNRTPDINELIPGSVYSLNGKNIEDSYKLFNSTVKTDVVALNSYYSEAKLSVGGYIDVGLQKENVNNEENFTPDYYGTSISYSIPSGKQSMATVNTDGLITAHATTDNETNKYILLTTRVTGVLGDYIEKETKIYISNYIAQMTIAKNIRVKKGETVDVYWYVTNKLGLSGDIAAQIYWTI